MVLSLGFIFCLAPTLCQFHYPRWRHIGLFIARPDTHRSPSKINLLCRLHKRRNDSSAYPPPPIVATWSHGRPLHSQALRFGKFKTLFFLVTLVSWLCRFHCFLEQIHTFFDVFIVNCMTAGSGFKMAASKFRMAYCDVITRHN